MEQLTKKTGFGLAIRDCGRAEYREVLALQQQLQEQRRGGQVADTVLLVEHPAVITLGARKSANRLLVSPDELARRGIDLVEIRRGGGATAHNPGQLVFYPILHLQELRLDVSQYVRTLEAIGIGLLAGLGVESGRRKGFPGLWVAERKIASLGVRVSRSVTCHGMAINIQNDLSLFELMIPCGLDGVQMTSVRKETGQTYDMEQIKSQLSGLLIRHVGGASWRGHPVLVPEKVSEKPVRRGMGFQPMKHRQDADATKAHGQDAHATFQTPSEGTARMAVQRQGETPSPPLASGDRDPQRDESRLGIHARPTKAGQP